jgi:hypothetical protein
MFMLLCSVVVLAATAVGEDWTAGGGALAPWSIRHG